MTNEEVIELLEEVDSYLCQAWEIMSHIKHNLPQTDTDENAADEIKQIENQTSDLIDQIYDLTIELESN